MQKKTDVRFIILTVIFISLLYGLKLIGFELLPRHSGDVAAMSGMLFLLPVLGVALVLGFIVAIMLLRQFRNRILLLCAVIAIPFSVEFFRSITVQYEQSTKSQKIQTGRLVEAQYAMAWKHLSEPSRVMAIITNIEREFRGESDLYIDIPANSGAILLALAMKNEQYRPKYEAFIMQNQGAAPKIPKLLLKSYTPLAESEIILLLETLKLSSYCVNYLENCLYSDERELISFEHLVALKFYTAAKLRLGFRIRHSDLSILEMATLVQAIQDEQVRTQLMRTIIEETDVFRLLGVRSFHTLLIANKLIYLLRNEPSFPSFMSILQRKLSKANTIGVTSQERWKTNLNQKGLEAYIRVLNILGSDHPYILTTPEFLKTWYDQKILERNNYKGGRQVLFRTFMLQARNLTMDQPYVSEPYELSIDDKVVDKGLTNEFGCIQYRFFGNKPEDVVTISTIGWSWSEYIGIEHLLDQRLYFLHYLRTRGFVENASDDELIRGFQRLKRIEETGELDKVTVGMAQQDYREKYSDVRCN